jgi:APA family basic amino acid/polyamine antiporter
VDEDNNMNEQESTSKESLVRGLRLTDATMIVVGSMIGSGIFIVSAESSRLVGSPGWLLMAWALAGVLTITGALSCAELAAMWPRAGGQYVFLREAYGPAAGFLFGWGLFLVIQTGTVAAVAIAFANFTGVVTDSLFSVLVAKNLVSRSTAEMLSLSSTNYIISPIRMGRYALSLSTQQLLAVSMILLLTVTNTFGLNVGKFIQNTFTFTKTAALFGLIVVGLALGWNHSSAAYTSAWWNPVTNGWNAQTVQPGIAVAGTLALLLLVGRAMVGPLFAQSAWNNVTFTGGEIENPGRNLPRSLLIGCSLVVGLYLLANLAYIVTLPLGSIQTAPQNRVATEVMKAIFGQRGTVVMAIAIMISTFGCNNGLLLAGARVYYAMARDGLFFKSVGALNARHVPAVALVLQGLWAALLTLPRTVVKNPTTGAVTFGNVYTNLLEYIVSADMVFYTLMVAAVIVMRRKAPAIERPYRTVGYPVVPVVYVLLAVLVILDLAYLTPQTSWPGYVIVLSGIPVYLVWRKR